jgi:hypothetical protein
VLLIQFGVDIWIINSNLDPEYPFGRLKYKRKRSLVFSYHCEAMVSCSYICEEAD